MIIVENKCIGAAYVGKRKENEDGEKIKETPFERNKMEQVYSLQ